MRDKFHGDDSEENQSQAAAIAWSQHNKHKKDSARTVQWRCPQCGNWDYEGLNPGGRGPGWHDCKSCGYREKSPTDMERRQSPEGWDEDEQGTYDYDDGWEPMPRVGSIDSAGTDNGADKHTCPKCDAKFNPSVGFERCPVCGHVLDRDKVFPDQKPKESRWQVVALGELQQPGGVGATQTTGPVDGSGVPEAPHDEDFADAGRNGFEQNVALQTWVNYAVDMLNRGRQDEEILAQLAHDGCPEPEAVLHRAKEQPEDVSPNEGAQDPFDIPFKEVQPTAEESLSQQPPVSQMTGNIKHAEQEKPNIFDKGPKGKPPGIFGPDFEGETNPDIFDEEVSLDTENVSGDDGSDWDDSTMGGGKKDVSLETTGPKAFGKGSRVQIKGSSIKGRVVSVLEDLWGQRTVKVALEEGGHLNVAEDRLALEGQTQNPVADIQSFIDSIPPVEPTHPSILARLENLEQVRRQVRAHISKVGFSDQLQLERFDHEAQDEIRVLREALGSVLREGDLDYLRNQPKYQVGDGQVVNREFNDKIAQYAAVWYAEQDELVKADKDQLNYAAAQYAERNNGDVRGFVAAVKKFAYPNERDPGEVDIGWPVRGTGDSVDMKRDDWAVCDHCGGDQFSPHGQCLNCHAIPREQNATHPIRNR
ncbi:MAG: hypothetical protein KGL39_24520 [Patescibacteria group bacterium]|nr:hypothetical protein [Patescibacteria group bacterium]